MDTWGIKIDRIGNGYLVHFNDGEVIQHYSYVVNDSPDGLRDGFLDMLGEIVNFLGESGSKHDKIRVKICYQVGECSKKELVELQKKTDWEIIC